jgi:excinuclease ABC subunit A
MQTILYGSDETFKLLNTPLGKSSNYFLSFEGIVNYINNYQREKAIDSGKKWSDQFVEKRITCPECNGDRLKKESLFLKLQKKILLNFHQWILMSYTNGSKI